MSMSINNEPVTATATTPQEKSVVRTDNRKMRRAALKIDNRRNVQQHLHPSQVKWIMANKKKT